MKNKLGANLQTFANPRVLSNGARTATRSASAAFRHGQKMAALLIILSATVGLALRAGIYNINWSLADSDRVGRAALVDTCARTFVLVLLSLIGLLVLGIMYGNVLGSVSATP